MFSVFEVLNDIMKTPTALAEYGECNKELKVMIKIISQVTSETVDDMIYLLTAIGLSPGGRSTVHIYTQTIHRTIRNEQCIEQHNNFGRVRAVPRLG